MAIFCGRVGLSPSLTKLMMALADKDGARDGRNCGVKHLFYHDPCAGNDEFLRGELPRSR